MSRPPLTRLRKARALLVCLATIMVPCTPASAAPFQNQSGVLPIDVTPTPSRTLAGSPISITGKTGSTGPNSKVIIRVKAPGATAPITLSASVKSNGTFTGTFSQTTKLGVYQVQATAPDGKGQASTTFRVVSPEVVPAEIGRSADSLVLTAARAVKAAKQALLTLPSSPERAEAEKRVAQLEQRLAQLPAGNAVLTQQMQKVFKARADVPMDNAQWDAYVGQLDTWQSDASAARKSAEIRIKQASAQTQTCGRLDSVNEMLTAASEVMSLLAAPFEYAKSFWIDKLPPAFVARAGVEQASPTQKFAAIQTMKLSAAAVQGSAGIVAAVPGFVLDVSAFLVQQEFSKYCQKFEGPITATFLGESFTTSGEAFNSYLIRLDGKIVLMYDKSAPANKPIGVLGYMEGNGRFDVRDNPKPVVRLTPGTVLFHKVVSPPGSGYFDEVGQGTRSFLPHSFRIPVKGTLQGDSIIIALLPAIHDFGAVIEGRSIYVVMPYAGMVPQIIDSKFPLQKAFPILERVIKRHPVLRVSYVGGTRAEGTFARDTTNADKTARVRTKLVIKACNPGCLKLPLSPAPATK